MAAPNAHATPATQPSAEPAARRRLPRRAVAVVAFLLLFAIGFGIGSLLRPDSSTGEDPIEAPDDAKKPRERLADFADDSADILERGDSELQRHRFRSALNCYDSLLDKPAIPNALLQYRAGLCREALAQTAQAIASYRIALTSADGPRVANASRLGLARCMLKEGKSSDVRHVLHPILMDEELQAKFPRAFLVEARYLVALAYSQEARQKNEARLPLDEIVAISPTAIKTSFYLDELADPKAAAAKKVEAESKDDAIAMVLRKPIKDQPAQIERIAFRDIGARGVLDRLASSAGLKTVWSDRAIKLAEARTLGARLTDAVVVDLAEMLADSIDVVCISGEGSLQFLTTADCSEKQLLDARSNAAARAFNTALKTDGSHYLAPAAYVELGSKDVRAEKYADAIVWYERAKREFPYSPFVTEANYNRGLIHVRRQEIEPAVKAFFAAVDQAPGHELALRAYLRIGVLYLEEERLSEAILPLRRAQSLAPGSPFQPLATLSLVGAYLKMNNPAQARIAMIGARSSLYKEPYKGTAAILDAYARYLLAKGNKNHYAEATDLLGTVEQYKGSMLLGPIGQYFLAEAFLELGFGSRAESILAKAEKEATGPITHPLTYRRGEVLLTLLQRKKAATCFESLQKSESTYRLPAMFYLARIDQMEKRWNECAKRCSQLWREPAFTQRGELLSIWGESLEAMGEFTKAARCYSGQPPE